MMFKILMIGHILGDFYFQSEKIAKEKGEKFSELVLHCIIYYLTLFFISAAFTDNTEWTKLCVYLLIVSVLHGITDYLKIQAEYKYSYFGKKAHVVFLLDQILHLGVLYLFVQILSLNVSNSSFIYHIVNREAVERFITPVLAVLICWKPASIFISIVFGSISKTISMAESNEECTNEKCPYRPKNQQEEVKIGSWIGILEREIMLILGLLNQIGAIGFVLTAKSVARFKQLENKAFAEKYLVGTLISAIIAFLCIILCKLV